MASKPKRLLAVLLALLTACVAGAALLGEPVELGVGESAVVDDLKVTFEGVDGDNRCPRNVNCIVAGKATVALVLEPPDGTRSQLRIDVPPSGRGKASFRDYEIVAGVAPEPIAGRRIEADEYVVTLVVTRDEAD